MSVMDDAVLPPTAFQVGPAVPASGLPDLAAVLGGLKDFQRRTVDYVFDRMYREQPCSRRFLIADEVGLGKTLVARGLIARVIEELWSRQERITVVYVCSNGGIARQNIRRLNVTGRKDFDLASRVTLLPRVLPDLERNRLNFVSFTPGTSFDLKSNLGIVEERAVLHHLLREGWGFRTTDSSLAVLAGHASIERLRASVEALEQGRPLADALVVAFHRTLMEAPAEQRLRERFDRLRDQARSDPTLSGEASRERSRWVGELRTLLARSCLGALRPDLIILDEFQRFKHLLGGPDGEESELSMLARDFFDYPHARVLLLSATPYKMYTLSHEVADDDHYRDFLQTLQFLHRNTSRFEELLGEYRRELYRLEAGSLDRLRRTRDELATNLRMVMARTERLAGTVDRGGMLREVVACQASLQAGDVETYLALQQIAREVQHDDTLEYWKSASFLLNFMDEYDLQRSFNRALGSNPRKARLAGILSRCPNLVLPWKTIRAYRSFDPGNARLRALLADTIEAGWWRLLWMPPSLPSYRLGGPFASASEVGLTKRLIFSAWRVVPKVIATLLSYEAEGRMLRHRERSPRNTPEARRRRRPLLRFTKSKGRLTGMPILALIYPSSVLARVGDPLSLVKESAGGGLPEARDLLRQIQAALQPCLDQVVAEWATEAAPDECWYWAAPVLLDLAEDYQGTRDWFTREDRPEQWAGVENAAHGAAHSRRWTQHVREVRRLLRGKLRLGQPPADLLRVLSRVALAAPGVCALRAMGRIVPPETVLASQGLRDAAAPVGWAFLTLFNQPEATALLRGRKSELPYWQNALNYAVAGGLSAVLDEYAHLLKESLGLREASASDVASGVGLAIRQALLIRTSSLGVAEVSADATAGKVEVGEQHLRARFAMRLGDEKSDEGGEGTRLDQVRDAFNSPFWPFVLATTSIGQEGLDFHPYCHAVVHWNLPPNPVDLEQREGRVHRYKGHAVRKNLARRYGTVVQGAVDPWEVMFEAARADRPPGASDLFPYWVFPLEGGAAIERHVPMLPLSRDWVRLDELRRSLVVYRMVFGQNRQEDLLAFLRSQCAPDQLNQLVRELRIDLAPPDPCPTWQFLGVATDQDPTMVGIQDQASGSRDDPLTPTPSSEI